MKIIKVNIKECSLVFIDKPLKFYKKIMLKVNFLKN